MSDYATQNIELYAKEEEIEQLKAANTALQRECLARGQRIAELEKLCTRAADALCGAATWIQKDELIAELRKAAE